MKSYADEALVVGGEERIVSFDSGAQNVEIEAGRVVVEFLGATFGLWDYARVVEGELGQTFVIGEKIIFELGNGLRGLIRVEARRHIGVFEW